MTMVMKSDLPPHKFCINGEMDALWHGSPKHNHDSYTFDLHATPSHDGSKQHRVVPGQTMRVNPSF